VKRAFFKISGAAIVAVFGVALFVISPQSDVGQGGSGAAETKVLADHGWGP
jgi:hypothetical protein